MIGSLRDTGNHSTCCRVVFTGTFEQVIPGVTSDGNLLKYPSVLNDLTCAAVDLIVPGGD